MAFALLPYALTTVAKVKTYAGIDSADTTHDDFISQLINAWSDFAQTYCGRRFLSQQYIEVKDAKAHSNRLFLNQSPVSAVALLEYRTGIPSAITWMTFDANSYLVYLASGYLQFFAKLAGYPQGYRVTYTAGYLINWANEGDNLTHTLPADLTGVITEIVATKVLTAKAAGVNMESTEGQSITYDSVGTKGISPQQDIVLSKYQRLQFAGR